MNRVFVRRYTRQWRWWCPCCQYGSDRESFCDALRSAASHAGRIHPREA